MLVADNKADEISNILAMYELMMVSPEKLKIMLKDPQKFIGIDESITKFKFIKDKYETYLSENTNASGVKTQ